MMKRVSVILSFLLASTLTLIAQSRPIDQVKADIIAFGDRVSSIDCDFVQTKESSLLAAPAKSSGHMTYRRPGYLEWNYVEPNPLTFVADGESVMIRKGDQSEVLGGTQGRMIKEMTRMIIGNIEGSVLANEKMFMAGYDMADGLIAVTLIPQRKDLQKMWSKLVLYYEESSLKATRFEMYESSGDLTVISFKNIKYGFSE
jgi:outer membrane lipoprotein-sorting protein